MGDKVIVLTMYGKDESIENISIGLFDGTRSYYSESHKAAEEYCNNINDLELKDNRWIYANIVGENEKIILEKPPKFDMVNRLDDLDLQRILGKINNRDIAIALKGIDEKTRDKFLKNMSQRAGDMLKEDIESLHLNTNDIRNARKKIAQIIHHWISTGEIALQDITGRNKMTEDEFDELII
jgi:flagellar motor switch protein FliG